MIVILFIVQLNQYNARVSDLTKNLEILYVK